MIMVAENNDPAGPAGAETGSGGGGGRGGGGDVNSISNSNSNSSSTPVPATPEPRHAQLAHPLEATRASQELHSLGSPSALEIGSDSSDVSLLF